MKRADEMKITEIFRRHIEAACDEVGEENIDCGVWPEDYEVRLANMLTQALCLMVESSHATSDAEF